VREPGDGDDAGATCPGPSGQSLPLPPACPDPMMVNDPARILSVSALDAATGNLVWRAPSTPGFGATTCSNGVVFAGSTTTFATAAYNADTGVPLWASPLGATTASGMAIAGPSVFIGTGISEVRQVRPRSRRVPTACGASPSARPRSTTFPFPDDDAQTTASSPVSDALRSHSRRLASAS
jgi:hypothetical protein